MFKHSHGVRAPIVVIEAALELHIPASLYGYNGRAIYRVEIRDSRRWECMVIENFRKRAKRKMKLDEKELLYRECKVNLSRATACFDCSKVETL